MVLPVVVKRDALGVVWLAPISSIVHVGGNGVVCISDTMCLIHRTFGGTTMGLTGLTCGDNIIKCCDINRREDIECTQQLRGRRCFWLICFCSMTGATRALSVAYSLGLGELEKWVSLCTTSFAHVNSGSDSRLTPINFAMASSEGIGGGFGFDWATAEFLAAIMALDVPPGIVHPIFYGPTMALALAQQKTTLDLFRPCPLEASSVGVASYFSCFARAGLRCCFSVGKLGKGCGRISQSRANVGKRAL